MNKSGMAIDAAKLNNTGPPPSSHTHSPSHTSASVSTSSFSSKPLKRCHKTQASFPETLSSSGRLTQHHNLPAVPCKKAKTGNAGLMRTSWQKPLHVQVQRRPMSATVDSNKALIQRRVPPKTRMHLARKVQQPVKGELWNSNDSSTVTQIQSETHASSEDDTMKCTSVIEEAVCKRPESLCESPSSWGMFGLRREMNTLDLSPVAEEASPPPSEAQNVEEQPSYRHISDINPSLIKKTPGQIDRSLSITHVTGGLEVPTSVQSSTLELAPQVTPCLEPTSLLTTTHVTLKSLLSSVILQGSQSNVMAEGNNVACNRETLANMAEGNNTACNRDIPANMAEGNNPACNRETLANMAEGNNTACNRETLANMAEGNNTACNRDIPANIAEGNNPACNWDIPANMAEGNNTACNRDTSPNKWTRCV